MTDERRRRRGERIDRGVLALASLVSGVGAWAELSRIARDAGARVRVELDPARDDAGRWTVALVRPGWRVSESARDAATALRRLVRGHNYGFAGSPNAPRGPKSGRGE